MSSIVRTTHVFVPFASAIVAFALCSSAAHAQTAATPNATAVRDADVVTRVPDEAPRRAAADRMFAAGITLSVVGAVAIPIAATLMWAERTAAASLPVFPAAQPSYVVTSIAWSTTGALLATGIPLWIVGHSQRASLRRNTAWWVLPTSTPNGAALHVGAMF